MAIAGAVLGGLGLIGGAIVLVIAISVVNSGSFQDFEDCMQSANSSAEEDRCAEDFGENLFK